MDTSAPKAASWVPSLFMAKALVRTISKKHIQAEIGPQWNMTYKEFHYPVDMLDLWQSPNDPFFALGPMPRHLIVRTRRIESVLYRIAYLMREKHINLYQPLLRLSLELDYSTEWMQNFFYEMIRARIVERQERRFNRFTQLAEIPPFGTEWRSEIVTLADHLFAFICNPSIAPTDVIRNFAIAVAAAPTQGKAIETVFDHLDAVREIYDLFAAKNPAGIAPSSQEDMRKIFINILFNRPQETASTDPENEDADSNENSDDESDDESGDESDDDEQEDEEDQGESLPGSGGRGAGPNVALPNPYAFNGSFHEYLKASSSIIELLDKSLTTIRGTGKSIRTVERNTKTGRLRMSALPKFIANKDQHIFKKIRYKPLTSRFSFYLTIDDSGSMGTATGADLPMDATRYLPRPTDMDVARLLACSFFEIAQRFEGTCSVNTINNPKIEEWTARNPERAFSRFQDIGGSEPDEAVAALTQQIDSTPLTRNAVILLTDGDVFSSRLNLLAAELAQRGIPLIVVTSRSIPDEMARSFHVLNLNSDFSLNLQRIASIMANVVASTSIKAPEVLAP